MIMEEEWWSSVPKRRLHVGNTYFEYKNMHKYTKVSRDQDGVEVKSMIDLVLVKNDMLHYVQDVRAVRGMGSGVSEQYVAIYKARLVGAWIRREG